MRITSTVLTGRSVMPTQTPVAPNITAVLPTMR